MIEKAKEIRKLIVYVLGVAAELLTMGVIPHPIDKYLYGVIAVLTGLGIYRAENADPPGQHEA